MIRLRTLGECLIELDGTALGPESDVLFTVLLYLTAERDRRLSRAAVAELFWPELPPRRARHCLRQVLYRLRALGLDVQAEHEHLLLAGAHVTPSFAATPTREQFDVERRAGTLMLGPLLAGCVPKGSPAFHEWFEAHRGHVHFHVRRVLLEKAREHRLRGEWSDVEWLSRECLRLDPLNEEATLTLAESMVMVGGKAEAIAYLDRYLAEIGGDASNVRLPATVLRRRIAERFPSRRYAGPGDRCLVGRADLLATVATSLLRARNGDGGAVLLWGPPGIGKTRLATEVAKIADVEGMRIVRVQCEESAAARPLAVFMEAVPELLAYSGAIGCAPSSLAYLRRLMQLDPTASAIDALDATTLAANIRRAVVDLVDAVSEDVPLLLVVDDAQWADPASWAVLRALVEWSAGKPVLLLFTSRTPHATPARPERTTTRLELHELRPLDDAAASELVQHVAEAAGRAVPADALAWCLEAGEGNPLFLQELAGHWIETDQTRGTPPSLQALLEGRIAGVSPNSRRMLQAVVLLGSYATAERVQALLGLTAVESLEAVNELSEQRLIRETGEAILARHTTIGISAVAALESPARKLLHRRVAALLEAEVSDMPDAPKLSDCYNHWRDGAAEDRASEAIVQAVPALLSRAETTACLALLDRSLAETRSRASRNAVLHARAVSAIRIARERKISLRDLASEHLPGDAQMRAKDRVEYVAFLWREACGASELLDELLLIAASSSVESHTRVRAVSVGLAISDNDACAEEAKRFVDNLADVRLTTRDETLAATQASMIFHCGFGDPARGLLESEKLRQLLGDSPASRQELQLLLNVADAHRSVGDADASVAIQKRVHEIASAREYYDLVAITADRIACNLLDMRRPALARTWIKRTTEMKDYAVGNLSFGSLETRCRAFLQQHKTRRASFVLDEMRNQQPREVSWRSRRYYLTLRAEYELARTTGRIPSALLEAMLEMHLVLRTSTLHDRAALAVARALVRTGDKRKAHSLLSAYVNEERRGSPYLSASIRDTLLRLQS